MEFEVSAELVGIYLEDAREHLTLLDAALLRLEREGHDPEIAASLLGPLHTLKGNSGMIGFAGVKDYVHRMEEVFARARDGALVLDASVLDRLLQGAAAPPTIVSHRRNGLVYAAGQLDALVDALHSLITQPSLKFALSVAAAESALAQGWDRTALRILDHFGLASQRSAEIVR